MTRNEPRTQRAGPKDKPKGKGGYILYGFPRLLGGMTNEGDLGMGIEPQGAQRDRSRNIKLK